MSLKDLNERKLTDTSDFRHTEERSVSYQYLSHSIRALVLIVFLSFKSARRIYPINFFLMLLYTISDALVLPESLRLDGQFGFVLEAMVATNACFLMMMIELSLVVKVTFGSTLRVITLVTLGLTVVLIAMTGSVTASTFTGLCVFFVVSCSVSLVYLIMRQHLIDISGSEYILGYVLLPVGIFELLAEVAKKIVSKHKRVQNLLNIPA